MKIGIVEDHFINRKIIKEKILPYEDIHIVIEAENGNNFFDLMKNLRKEDYPQVVLIDLEMPVLDGISTISLSSIRYPSIKFIVLTIYEDNDKIFDAIKAGASGYLLKEDKAINIVDAIANVIEYDGIPMSPAIARRAMKLLSGITQNNNTLEKIEDYQLSSREIQILKEIVGGNNPADVAEKLFISPNTVRTHVNNIYKKLHLNSRAQVISLAHKNNWI
ncbi:two component transcriptional regulator, LuxR family [Kaistella chaponensis]|uniref:Two component transcriptional regulator, LuxR family n=1 Tax=Kaistella chaponensis TaxID=713588 RepID=A0A1N7KGB1_9FLAO|nr:response regulator transcription factor [Kaistella chaponensis]SIS60510.1 two component transcriptional regulator, LuxR family [Kaistella chaponensis]